jgi:uncharacterized protein (TIGR02421 family)
LDEKINLIDKEILRIAKNAEKAFENINPINSLEQKRAFLQSRQNYNTCEPCFKYKPLKNFGEEKNSLYLIKKEMGQSIIEKFLFLKINALEKEIALLESINTKDFCHNSKEHYSSPKKNEIKLAEEILKKKTNEEKKENLLNAQTLLERLSPRLEGTGFSIEINGQMSAKAAVNLAEKKLKLNKDALFSGKDAERYFVHEVETHIYRYLNGATQPVRMLSLGFGGEYLKTEEGLAVYNEKSANVTSKEQERVFAGRLYAVNYALSHDFSDTFEEMNKYFNEEGAYSITQRVKRGVPNCNKGAFTKDYCYFSGLIGINEYISKGKSIKDLYYGKFSTEETGIVKKIPNLIEPKYLPRKLA